MAVDRAEYKKDMTKLQGSIVALVTPMKSEPPHELDVEALKNLVEWHIAEGTDAIVAMGTTGESPTLTSGEWETVVSTCVSVAAGRVAVIAGTGTNCTATSVEKTKRAQELGADAALVVTPYYNKPSQAALFEHYRTIAAAVPNFPIITYNVPSRTACDLLPETIARIAKEAKNVIGNKEASGQLERFEAQRKLLGPTFRLFSGEDCQSCEAMLAGVCDGVISVTSNVVPRQMHQMCQCALKRDRERAKQIDDQLMGLHKNLFCESNPTATKWLLAQTGKIPSGIRLPLLPLSAAYHESVRNALKEAQRAQA
ncbi:Dihydrodipicolinate synthase, related [Neospora caninum Liverpool]|uniref:4-hydroxy-tetrahydrodipicolinate synthase n=1 Tax=Neospora caninum (strain Liverpool) TaxID=572307 RepID=F0VE13_NEOCL|nr:Dihydrodipicolinate synthase, related [Neospora caninum Liverpool]CBZ51956.1 Dihydrodipicolinate synthase, related [Neospora caninum Liverpool]CEL65917.1 TPA: Dihydrodipicolinate synthase, related [Neospora caninum Liverpool]|eukprot:XP_003881989.1 Dihydrodipicolinate synthase, related [Neospora caninum Liverpool]